VKRYTTASCFATFLLPHVLFVADIEERRRIARICCLAWNIALFPDTDDRAIHIEKIIDLIDVDENGAPPPPGYEKGFRDELRMLVDEKRDLFPWQLVNVASANIEHRSMNDVLVVTGEGRRERIDLIVSPGVEGMSAITSSLVQIHTDTLHQRDTLERSRATLGLLEQIVTEDMVRSYCVQRADLRAYHRILTAWGKDARLAKLKPALDRFLSAINEIEEDSKAVLEILVDAMNASHGL
jgi:hypothetical protein